jgi:hypothetical protein
MKSTILIAIVIAAIASAACVRSIQPFYEHKDVYFDRSLIGTWTDAKGKESWKIERRGDGDYLIDETDEKGKKTRFEARLFKLDGRSFIDLAATTSGDAGSGHLLAVHTFLAIEKDLCTSKMSYLDPTWLKQFLAKNPNAIRHSNIEGEIVFTDSTKNLKSFIRKHLDSPGAFEETETLFKKGETQCEQKN